MSDYLEQQRAKSAEQLACFHALLSVGQTAGLWTVLPSPYEGKPGLEHMAFHREVTYEGGRFGLHVNSRDGRVRANVADLSTLPHQCGVRVHPSDHHELPNPDASVALDRDPLQAARALHRNVVAPGLPLALWCRDQLVRLQARRERLLAHVEAAKALGLRPYGTRALKDSETWEATLWHSDLGEVRVNAEGKALIERDVRVTLDFVPTLAAAVKGAQ
jgi:hypothetical protein